MPKAPTFNGAHASIYGRASLAWNSVVKYQFAKIRNSDGVVAMCVVSWVWGVFKWQSKDNIKWPFILGSRWSFKVRLLRAFVLFVACIFTYRKLQYPLHFLIIDANYPNQFIVKLDLELKELAKVWRTHACCATAIPNVPGLWSEIRL